MRITRNLDQLLSEGEVTREEYRRLKCLASRRTASLVLNTVIASGVIAVVVGTTALLLRSEYAILIGCLVAVAVGVALALAGYIRAGRGGGANRDGEPERRRPGNGMMV